MRLIATTLLILAPLAGQEKQDGKGTAATRPPQNLKVLNTSGENLMRTMHAFSSSLGVKCDHCHVQGNFASDENPKKEIARKMLLMAREVNRNFPQDNRLHVSCYTCHRGEVVPRTAPESPAQW
jgi:hypothetical protein